MLFSVVVFYIVVAIEVATVDSVVDIAGVVFLYKLYVLLAVAHSVYFLLL